MIRQILPIIPILVLIVAFFCLIQCSTEYNSSNDEQQVIGVPINSSYDFVWLFEENQAQVSNEDFAYVDETIVNENLQIGLFEHAPCRIEFPNIYIGKNAYLTFKISLLEKAWDQCKDGVLYQIHAVTLSGESKTLFQQHVDPKQNPSDRQWLPQRLAIDTIQDSTITLIFETKAGPSSSSNNHSDWAFWANPMLHSDGQTKEYTSPIKPNIMLITLDTTRVDYLGCYGNEWIQTPVMDEIARQGILFEDAYTVSYHTNPSHLSMLTSVTPFAHGLVGNEQQLTQPLPGLPQILKEAGYTNSVAISAYHMHNFMNGMSHWFDFYDKPRPLKIRPGAVTTSAAIHRLEQMSGSPFFCWVHYYDPHQPYRAFDDYHKMYYEGNPTTAENSFREHAAFPKDWLVNKPFSWVRPFRDLEYFKKEYGAEVTYMDAQIGRLLDSLKRLKQYDNTLLVVIGDHGESMGEHEIYFDHWTQFNTDLHVPFLMAYPNELPQNLRLSEKVSTLDLAPTLLDLLNMNQHPLAEKIFDGRSLRPLLEKNESLDSRIDTSNGVNYINIAVWDDQYKLIWEMAHYEYHEKFEQVTDRVRIYDRKQDPHEQDPIAHFYWGNGDDRQDDWEQELASENLKPVKSIANIRDNAKNKQVPTAAELESWLRNDIQRDYVQQPYQNSDFYEKIVLLMKEAKEQVNPVPIQARYQNVPSEMGGTGVSNGAIQTVDESMQEFLHSLGYTGN